MITSGEWYFCTIHNAVCKIIDTQALWGEKYYRVWLPGSDKIVRVPASSLKPVSEAPTLTADSITYVAAAARVADALTQDILLAPIESSVIPLPHQIHALSRAVSGDHVRFLLADEVGLGKTIEAGLIMRELKLRGMVKRVLVITPKGLVTQWVAEMQTHFGEDFRVFIPGEFSSYRQIVRDDNIWKSFDQVICSMDSVKPLDHSNRWSVGRLMEYNKERFEDLIHAGWDLIIVDEAHRLGGSTDQVARYKLGQGLANAAPYFLMLSATPHQGKTDSFHRLVSLLDAEGFPDVESVIRERVQPYVIRTEKRQAIDSDGRPLFKPRRTQLAPVSWEERHRDQRLLYKAVTEYVRQGYNQAVREKKNYIGFLMILMQRLVVSSTSAIRATLERRLEVLEEPAGQMSLFESFSIEDWEDLDGQEQMESVLLTHLNALKNEHSEVKLLLEAARSCEQLMIDAKAEALLEWIYRLQQEENDPDLKALVFTEFVPTQEMLRGFLSDRGFSVVCLNGSMNMEDRKNVQDSFASDARIMISTDAGGEGLNLQFCHVVINYDIPWNPMKLEQRIGRVDRIGQSHVVRAVNFVFQDSVEHRVREVLEEKLAVIMEEFGVDKAGDVLDSAESGRIFDELYLDTLLNPDDMDSSVGKAVAEIQDKLEESRGNYSVLGVTDGLNARDAQHMQSHPLQHWVELMTVSYLNANGGSAEKMRNMWDLKWPDGEITRGVVFTIQDIETASSQLLNLEHDRVRSIVTNLPRFVEGQPIPSISIPGLAKEIDGFWSLWRISIHSDELNDQRILAVFLHDDGRVLGPTAKHIWNQLLSESPVIHEHLAADSANDAFNRVMNVAEEQGNIVYSELVQSRMEHLKNEKSKGKYAFATRRRAIDKIGLPQVRDHRFAILEQEEHEWKAQLKRRAQIIPEMIPLLLIKVNGRGNDE